MPQLLLQGVPDGAIRIGPALGAQRYIVAALVANGHARPCEVERSGLGIAHRTLMHWTRQLDEQGADSFLGPRGRRGGAVMTVEKAAGCGRHLDGLPALCANGLLSGLGRHVSLPGGYYTAMHILTLLGFMALARIRRPEGLRHVPPGELGKSLGLDRAPEVRTLDKDVRATQGRIRKLQAERVQDLQRLEEDAGKLREKRRGTPRKVAIEELPEDERPRQLLPLGKRFTDTVKMIAYRAETALVGLLRPHLAKKEEARALVRELFVSSADLEPDGGQNTLAVRVHRMACPAHDKAVAALLADLTGTAFPHPETGMRMVYELA